MTTPTPGDLSARHVIAEAIKLANGGSFNTPADVADWLRDELAALSALPAGGEPTVGFNDDGSLDEVCGAGDFHLEQMDTNAWWMQLGPHMVWLRARGKITAHFCKNEAQRTTPPADAAVGAQGDERERLVEMLDSFADEQGWLLFADGRIVGSRQCYMHVVLGHELPISLAAPAAGKGVDGVSLADIHLAAQMLTWGRDEGLTEKQEAEVDAHAQKLFAALTRQPVAGDGMVLVPREPTHAMIAAGWKSIRCDVDPGRKPQTNTARRAARNAYVSMLAAAPAATPTDGGEG